MPDTPTHELVNRNLFPNAVMNSEPEEVVAAVRLGIDQANQGLVGPLDVEALIKRVTVALADEGIGESDNTPARGLDPSSDK